MGARLLADVARSGIWKGQIDEARFSIIDALQSMGNRQSESDPWKAAGAVENVRRGREGYWCTFLSPDLLDASLFVLSHSPDK